ncbi:MAG: TRAP transporter substrate-binding protein [Synergistaceae bacterium]|jgi:tripartite ATP-independent transporter DctP family solute receptor|nr:TRAP transporter substrate-binding protein [Synergistaceae bacterium]
MKKKSVVLVVLLTVFVGSAFEGFEPSSATAAPGFEYEKVTLQIGHVNNTEHHYQTTAQSIADEISAATGGNVKIEIYPSEQLGSGRDQVESVRTNTQSMVFTPTAYLAGYEKLFDILEMPYLVTTYEDAQAFSDTKAAAEFERLAEAQGFVILGWCANGFHNVTSNKPIRVPEDLKGLKIRVGASQLAASMWGSIDATPVNISMSETYTSLDNGTVDAQANPVGHIITNKLYEVQKYLNMTKHSFVFQCIIINKDVFYGFSPELQKLMRETFNKYSKKDMELVASSEAEELKVLEGEGMTVINPDLAAFKKAFVPFYETYNSKNGKNWADLMTLMQ